MSSVEDQYSSSVELELDDANETLGDKVPKTITDNRRRLLLQQAGSRRVAADVVALAHGTFDGQPASLVALRFQFSYQPHSSNRLSSAELNVSFRPAVDGAEYPNVQRFAPTNIRADAVEAGMKKDSQVGLSAGLSAMPVPVGADIKAHRSTEITYVQEFRCDIIGEPWTSDEAYSGGYEVDNAVTWHLNENKLLKKGIPRELRAVLIVRRSQALVQARVTAKVMTNWGLSLSGSLFSPTRPLMIADSVAFGNQPPSRNFNMLSTDDLNVYVGLDRPFVSADSTLRT